MLKKLAIACVALAGIYALVTGDYRFEGPRYRVLAYAYLVAAQFEGPRPSAATTDGRTTEAERVAGGAPSHGFVHLGSLRSAASAEREWSRLQESFPAHLADLELVLERVEMGPENVFYRVLADTAGSPLNAQQVCSALRRSDQFCAPIDPGAS